MIESNAGSGFVLENPDKLRRIVHHFRAHLGLAEPVAPRCNAPWVSAVIESDGTVRPCFFHEPIGNATGRSADRSAERPAGCGISRVAANRGESCLPPLRLLAHVE